MEYTKLRNINRGYMKLEVWQKSLELFELIWFIVINNKIDFKLRNQIVDSAQSVSSNIAEGYSRRSIKEYIQFLYISLGSLSETLTRCIGLKITQTISIDEFQKIDTIHYEIENKLLRLIDSLQCKKEDGTWNDRISEDIPDYG